jgi:integrase
MPTVVAWLRRHRERQADEQAVAPVWETNVYEGGTLSLVFTTPSGGLVLRQTVAKLVKQSARTAGIEVDIGTHTGRSSVTTTLWVDGEEAPEDIARYVGHSQPSTTAGYVKRLGRRPKTVAKRAADVLDGQGDEQPGEVRNHPDESGSDAGSNADGQAGAERDGQGQNRKSGRSNPNGNEPA